MNLALGTPVVFTQCAAVARKGDGQMWNRGWHIPEKNNGITPWPVVFRGATPEQIDEVLPENELLGPTVVRFVNGEGKELPPETIAKFNKATVVWDARGSGVVCGLETKLHGVSHRAAEDATGWLDNYGQIKLYVVRSRLEGNEFAYVPTWAIQPMVNEHAA